MSSDNIANDLIESLTDELDSQRAESAAHPVLRATIWLTLGAIYTAAIVMVIGLRPDLIEKFAMTDYVFDLSLAFITGIGASITAFYLCIPDMRGKSWLVIVPFILTAIFTLWIIIKVITEGFIMPELRLIHCLTEAALFVAVPAALLTFFTSKKSATTKPVILSIMNGISVTALGYVGIRMTCMLDTAIQDLIYHVLPFMFCGMVAGFIARRFYQW